MDVSELLAMATPRGIGFSCWIRVARAMGEFQPRNKRRRKGFRTSLAFQLPL